MQTNVYIQTNGNKTAVISTAQTYATNYTQTDENALISIALSDENVLGARCVFVDNAYVIAIITTPFYLKSERDEWFEDMQELLSSQTDLPVHLSLDLDIYRNIRQGMNDKDKIELLESVLSRKDTEY